MTSKSLKLFMFAVVLMSVVILSGGCDGGGAKQEIKLSGDLHGELASAFREEASIVPASQGGANSIFLISDLNGISNAKSASALSEAAKEFKAGNVVAVEHADETEVNTFLKALGLPDSFTISSNDVDKNVELYSIGKRGKDLFVYIIRSDNNIIPVSKDVSATATISDGPNVSQISKDVLPDAANQLYSDKDHQKMRVRGFLEWSTSLANEESALRSNAAGNKLITGAENDIRQLAQAVVIKNDCSYENRSLIITHTIYACHSFKDGTDWYIVDMSSMLNPEKKYSKRHVNNYSWNGYNDWKCDIVENYVSYYNFNQYIGDQSTSVTQVSNYRSVPENINSAETKTTGFEWSLGGSVGCNGASPALSVTGGVSFSTSETITINDYDIINHSTNYSPSNAAWEYKFRRPTNGNSNWYCKHLNDAVIASRTLLQPHDVWIWQVSKNYRDTNFSDSNKRCFNVTFKWTNGYTRGAFGTGWWIYGVKRQDTDTDHEQKFTVPLSLPPRVAVDKSAITFDSNAGSATLNLLSEDGWSASSNSSWCTINKTSGAATGETYTPILVEVGKNETGVARTACISISDGKETSKIEVTQSRY